MALGAEKAYIYSVKDGGYTKKNKGFQKEDPGERCEERSYRRMCEDPSVKI